MNFGFARADNRVLHSLTDNSVLIFLVFFLSFHSFYPPFLLCFVSPIFLPSLFLSLYLPPSFFPSLPFSLSPPTPLFYSTLISCLPFPSSQPLPFESILHSSCLSHFICPLLAVGPAKNDPVTVHSFLLLSISFTFSQSLPSLPFSSFFFLLLL